MKKILTLTILIGGALYLYQNYINEPFLPLKEGLWEIHEASRGTNTRCIKNSELNNIADPEGWLKNIQKTMPSGLVCSVTSNHGDNFKKALLTCSESGASILAEVTLTKLGKSHYTLSASVKSEPYMPQFDDIAISMSFKRKGGC